MVTDLRISYCNNFYILFLNTTVFYNFMLPVKIYVAMNTFCRSMTYYQKSFSLQLKGIHPLRKRKKTKNREKKHKQNKDKCFKYNLLSFF
jgi:hypothetical protein